MVWINTGERANDPKMIIVKNTETDAVLDAPPGFLERENNRWKLVGRAQTHRNRVLVKDTEDGLVIDISPTQARGLIGRRTS